MFLITTLKSGDWLNLRRVRAYPRIFLLVSALVGVAWISGLHEKMRPGEGVVTTDFINVYAAGEAVHEGHPADAYDWGAQKNREDQLALSANNGKKIEKNDGYIPWLYPPTFLAVAWLIAFLPYFPALAMYSIMGLAAFGAAMRKLAPPYKESLWALAAFPGVFVNLFSGQNGFITTAFLAAGLFLLDESPVAAGVAFGFLSYKPHFFALIPLVLLAGRCWKALAAASISAGVCAGLSLLAFGIEPWLAFIRGLSATSGLLKIGTERWLGTVHSVFSAVRILGGGMDAAYAVQTIVAIAAVFFVIEIWRHRKTSLAVRGASLVAAMFLISPYFFVYDQVFLAIPIALLAGQGLRNGFFPFEKTFLFALWLLPYLVQDSGAHFSLPLTPPMLAALMYFCWKRAKAERESGRGF